MTGRPKKETRNGLKTIAVFVCGVLLLSACSANPEQAAGDEEASVPTVTLATVEEGVLEQGVHLSGKVTGDVEVAILPKLSGKIERVAVSVGDAVKKGDLLVQLDQSDIRSQVSQAEAGVQAARAGVEMAREQAQSQVLNTSAAYTQAKLGVEQAAAQLNAAKTAYENAKADYERIRQLAESGLASQQQLEQAKLGMQQAEAGYKQAESAYENAQEGLKVARKNQLMAERQTAVKSAEAQLQQAQAGLEAARQQLENTRITAPVDGRVASLSAVVGAMAAPGSPLLTIVDMDPAVIEVLLPENVYPMVDVGQEVEVQVQRETFAGKVRSKDMTVNPANRTYLLKVEVPNPDWKLVSGMTASLFILENGAEKGLLIPAEAYMDSEKPGRGSVMVYKDGVVEERTVTIGKMTSRQVQILSGLSAGEKVVTKGQHLLKDGDRVAVADAPSAEKPAKNGKPAESGKPAEE